MKRAAIGRLFLTKEPPKQQVFLAREPSQVAAISNTDGSIAATLAASCEATAGSVRFQVSDGDLTGSGDLQLDVDPNDLPVLGAYQHSLVLLGEELAISPTSIPSDNGSVLDIEVSILPDTWSGTVGADLSSGRVEAGNASPVDTYEVNVRITDNCGAVAEQEFSLRVATEQVFMSGFETP